LRARDEGYAYAFSDTGAIRAAVDQDLVEFDAKLDGAREVAFFPADDGGLDRNGGRACTGSRLRPGAGVERVHATVPGAGAIVSFSGITRDVADGSLDTMEIEHYPA
jgi:hypothetical protein